MLAHLKLPLAHTSRRIRIHIQAYIQAHTAGGRLVPLLILAHLWQASVMPQMRVFIAEFIPLAATLRVSPYVNSRRQLDVVWVVFGPFDLLSLASACRLSAVDRVPPADQLTTESPGLPHWWLPAVAARFFCLILQSRPISNRINRSATLDACHIGCLSHWLPVTLDACHIGCLPAVTAHV